MLERLSIALLAAALPMVPAWAASSAGARLDPLAVALIDLNPGDGVTPWIQLAGGSYGSHVSVNASDPLVGISSETRWSLVPWGPAAAEVEVGLSRAAARVGGDVAGGSGVMSASGATLGSLWPGNAGSFSATAEAPYGYSSFTLSPYTLLVISGTANLFAQTTIGLDPLTWTSESASASVQLSVQGPAAGGGGNQSSNDGRSVSANWTMNWDPSTGEWSYGGMDQSMGDQSLAVSFTNYTAGPLSGNLQVTVNASGNSALAPVPEVETWALMLAGLSAIGWVAQRRRR